MCSMYKAWILLSPHTNRIPQTRHRHTPIITYVPSAQLVYLKKILKVIIIIIVFFFFLVIFFFCIANTILQHGARSRNRTYCTHCRQHKRQVQPPVARLSIKATKISANYSYPSIYPSTIACFFNTNITFTTSPESSSSAPVVSAANYLKI